MDSEIVLGSMDCRSQTKEEFLKSEPGSQEWWSESGMLD